MSAAGRVPAVASSAAPAQVPMARVTLACAGLVAVEVAAALLVGLPRHEALLGACSVLAIAFATVFCLGAVTVAGFLAGAGAAGVVLLVPGSLPATLGAALLVALACGTAPGWARVEAWQATRTSALTAAEEVAAARDASGDPPAGLRALWRTDRVLAAFLVLAFPPGLTAAALAFVSWSAGR